MNTNAYKELNGFLVDVFNEILKTEQSCLKNIYDDISLKEMHVIEAVCMVEHAPNENQATPIANSLRITTGSLTTAVALLEKKGYLIRKKDEFDKRIVHIYATDKGKAVNRYHQNFHEEMIDDINAALTDEELNIFVRGLQRIRSFFQVKNQKDNN